MNVVEAKIRWDRAANHQKVPARPDCEWMMADGSCSGLKPNPGRGALINNDSHDGRNQVVGV